MVRKGFEDEIVIGQRRICRVLCKRNRKIGSIYKMQTENCVPIYIYSQPLSLLGEQAKT